MTTTYLDEAIGETRLVTVDAEGRFAALAVERWSERGRLARLGEIYLGRVARIEARLGGAFVDLGLGPEGFLRFRGGKTPVGVHEGSRVKVEIAAEAAPGKGPRLRRLPDAAETGDFPRRLSEVSSLAANAIKGPEARRIADEALDAALAREIALAGGGSIAIEPTRALTAIDVDSGNRTADQPGRLARSTNLAAVDAVARHIALRALSGLIVIDLLHTEAREDRDAVRERLAAQLSFLGLRGEVGGVSRFGLLELAVERRRRPLHEIMLEDRRLTVESVALIGLRRLEDEALADRAARLLLQAPAPVVAWLEGEGAAMGWESALTGRLGQRFQIEPWADQTREGVEVRAL